MREITYTVTDPDGIHARPAGLLVKEASRFISKITVSSGKKECDAKKIFAVMSLGVKQGDTISVTIDGADEEDCANELDRFLKTNL